MPRAAKPPPEPPKPLTALEQATIEHERAQGALARAEANLEEVRQRQRDTATGLEAATAATRSAGIALVDDPGAEVLLNDSVAEMTRLENRRKALEKQTLPAALEVVEARRGELAKAHKVYAFHALREAIRVEVLPRDQAFVRAAKVAAEALAAATAIRRDLKAREIADERDFQPGGWLSASFLALGVPSALAQLTTTQVTYHAGGGAHAATPNTGGDAVGRLASRFGIDPAIIPEEPALAELGEQP